MDLIEFLTARLDEDAWAAAEATADDYGVWMHIERHQPARVLREVAAKRALVQWAIAHPRRCADVHPQQDSMCHGGHGPHELLLVLAVVDSDHEDFDPAWTVTPVPVVGS